MAKTIQSLEKTIADLIKKSCLKYGGSDIFVFKDKFRTHRYTYSEIYTEVLKIITFFENQNLKKGDKVIIWYYNSPQWASVFLACATSGIIVVPIDFRSKKSFVEAIQKETGAKKIFTSHFKNINDKLKISLENFFIEIDKLKPTEKEYHINEEDVLEIVYTSGTTSDPKGVVITHKNVVANIHSLKKATRPDKNDTFLSIIPLSHMLEQSLGFLIPIHFGSCIVYTISQKSKMLADVMVVEKINYVIAVPAFLQIFKNKIEERVRKENSEKSFQKILKLPFFFRNLILRRKIHFLKYLKNFIVGGSSLDIDIEKFWNRLGVTVLQGYGLTETSPIMTASTQKLHKIGTVGRVLPNQKIKLLNDGEILCKGDNIFSEYYKNQKETDKVLKNGWFYTGDLGKIDDDGFLKIVGRKKNMILTDSGLNIYPEDIEKLINSFSEIKDSCVLGLGNKKNIITATVVLNKNVREFNISSFLSKINESLSGHQKVQKLTIWADFDFPRTSSLKIKRGVVADILTKQNLENKSEKIGTKKVDELIEIISRLAETNLKEIAETSSLYVDLHIDSIRRVELLSIIEDVYETEIEEEKINDKTTIADLRILIENSNIQKTKNRFNFWSFAGIILVFRFIFQEIIFIFLTFFYNPKIIGEDNLKTIPHPVIFVLNHTSHLDTPNLVRVLPYRFRWKLAFAAANDYFFERKEGRKEWLKDIGIFLLRLSFNIYPFSRDKNIKRTMELTGKILDKNFSIAIFPEGTRTIDGKMNHFLSGIGLLALEMQVPIIPIKTEGLFNMLPKGKIWPRRGNVVVKIGKIYKASVDKSYLQIASELEKEIANL